MDERFTLLTWQKNRSSHATKPSVPSLRSTIFSKRFGGYDDCSKGAMAKKYKKIWDSKEEHDAWEAHVDETLRRLRELAEKAQAEIDAKKASAG